MEFEGTYFAFKFLLLFPSFCFLLQCLRARTRQQVPVCLSVPLIDGIAVVCVSFVSERKSSLCWPTMTPTLRRPP